MTVPTIQTALNAGELSPALYGRTDLEKYRRGGTTMRNFFASYRGGGNSRAGTLFCGQTKQGNLGTAGSVPPPRNIPFQFSATQGFVIEAGEKYFRFLTDGGYVLEASKTITGLTAASPGVFNTAPLAHGFADNDEVFVAGIQTASGPLLQVNGRSFLVANATTYTFTLQSPLDGSDLNTGSYEAYASGGTAARIYTLSTPYAAVDLPYLKFTQSADVMSLTLVNQQTKTEYPPYDLARVSTANWTLTKTTFSSGITRPASISLTETDSGVTTKSFYYQFVATAVDRVTGSESIASPVGTVLAVDIAAEAATIVVNCAAVAAAGAYNFYATVPAYLTPPSAGGIFGYIGTSFGPSFTDTNIVPSYTQSPPLHRNPFATSSLLAVAVTAGGSGYTDLNTTATITSPIGDDPVLTPVVTGGVVQWVVVDYAGSGLTGGEAVSFISSGGYAAGQVVCANNFSPADTVTLNGVTWTLVSPITGPQQTQIGTSLATSLGALAADLNASASASLLVASYAANSTSLLVTYKTAGSAGNTYSMAVSSVGATVSGPFLTGGGGSGTGATATTSIGPATGTYPSVVAYFQQRRFYGNTTNQPDTYFASRPGAFNNMDTSVPTVASDAITGAPWSQQVNGIQWMLNMPGGLVIFTGQGAWQLSANGSGLAISAAITPENQTANPQAYNGCSPLVPPIAINYDILYVQEKGSIVRDLSYNYFINIYTGTDMTVLSNHLFEGYTISQWGWAEEPNKLLWAVRNDGTLLCLTYLKEQDVYAWTRHDTNGLFQSVAVVSEPPVNAPYFVVKRLIQNGGTPVWAYYQERMDDRLWANQSRSWCVDAGLTLPKTYPAATLTVTSAYGVPTLMQPSVIYGGANYSPTTYARVVDPTGTGAIATITLSGSVVVNAAVTGALAGGYSQPQFQVIDPTRLGGGAAVSIFVTDVTTVNADAPVFSTTSVGGIIDMAGRQMVVTAYITPSRVQANVIQAHAPTIPNDPLFTPIPVTAGNWSITNPVSAIYGLNHLEGMLVSILADGVVVAPQIVSGGTITLPEPATDVVVGLGFTAQLQTMNLDVPGGVTVQGRRKEIDSVVVRIEKSGAPFEVGINQPDASTQPGGITVPWAYMTSVQGAVTGSASPLQPYDFNTDDIFVGVFSEVGATQARIAIQQTAPLPLNITALMPWARIQDDVDSA